jgi:hypothetical protein
MLPASLTFAAIPDGLRIPLLEEYRLIAQNFMERKWLPTELSGGRFCEIVYTILDGYAKGSYEPAPIKPNNFVQACRNLENNANVPRSFQILIPRFLPALYEIRNNRGVGHVGGDVDPNFMDSTAVFGIVNWIMAELIRVLHQMSTDEAQKLVNHIAERRIPLVWEVGDVKRVLNPEVSLKDQVLLLVFSSSSATLSDDLLRWTEYENKAYFKKLLKSLHKDRFIELSADETKVEILPPGVAYVEGKLLPSLI